MKNKFLSALFLCVGLSSYSQAQIRYEAELPLYDQSRFLGDVKVTIENETLISVDKASLLNVLRGDIQESTMRSFESLPAVIDPQKMPLPLNFDSANLKLDMPIGVELRSSDETELREDIHEKYRSEALQPSPFGGAINYRLEQTWSDYQNEKDYFNGQFDSFINFNTVVIENQSFYQSNIDQKWFRGDTRLVKDFEKQQIRFQAGDVHPQVQGFMVGRPLGGVNISRNFSLNPYRLPYPTGSENFTLQSRSLVKYFVNGTLIKSEYLPAGNYTANNIPLNNGLNVVVIEATDDLGQKKVFIFRTAASINLLNKGESRFDLSYGTPFNDTNFKRDYVEKDGELLSSFFQYGFSSSFSTSAYVQHQKDFTLLGGEAIQATPIGNIGAGYAGSQIDKLNGNAVSASYQLLGQGSRWTSSYTLGLRYESRSDDFRASIYDIQSKVKNAYSGNIAFPIADFISIAFGGNLGDVRDNSLSDRYGYDTTISTRILGRHNLSFFIGRNRDEFKNWNDIAYAFLTITFPESNDFITGYYDQQNKISRASYLKDNQGRLYTPRMFASLENGPTGQSGEADILFPTPVAEIGARLNGFNQTRLDKVSGRQSLRLNSAIAWAYDDGDWGLSFSRPVPSSFVIFSPDEKLEDQTIALKSTSPFAEAETGFFGEITFSNLLAYQYREIQVDPSMLEEGRSLKKEKFVLYPTYRSAHLVRIEDNGSVMLRGFLQTPDGKPWALQVGHIGEQTFFTNRDGEFFVEGIGPGKYEMKLEGQTDSLNISVSEKDQGIKNIGTLILEEDE